MPYTYDSMDGLKKAVYPNGEYVEYTYDDASRLTGVKTSYGTLSCEYDKLDRLVRVVTETDMLQYMNMTRMVTGQL